MFLPTFMKTNRNASSLLTSEESPPPNVRRILKQFKEKFVTIKFQKSKTYSLNLLFLINNFLIYSLLSGYNFFFLFVACNNNGTKFTP